MLATEINTYGKSEHLKEQQIAIIFCALSKGRKADKVAWWVSTCIERVLSLSPNIMPIELINALPEEILAQSLKPVGLSNQLAATLKELGKFLRYTTNYREITLAEWMSINGIGLKIGNFIMSSLGSNAVGVVVLDVHILSWIRENTKVGRRVPKNSPSNLNTYEFWSREYLKLVEEHYPSQCLADVDLIIWNQQRTKQQGL